MDFKRIEWIFFVAFLGLNIFLFGIYREGIKAENSVSYPQQTEKIENRLAKDQIKYEKSLSTEKFEGYYLSAEQTNFYEVIQKKQLNSVFNLSHVGAEYTDTNLESYPQVSYYINEKKIPETLSSFLDDENTVLFGKEYHYLSDFSTLDADSPEILASQSYKNIPFKDDTSQLILKLEKSDEKNSEWEKITKYTQTHVQGIEELRDKMELYTEKEAIETLYINNKIPAKSEITFRKLAYTRIYKIREKNVYVPVWFVGIKTNDGISQVEQVNAMNNTIISSNTVPKVEN